MEVSSMIVPAPGTFFLVLGGYFLIMALIGYYSAKKTNSLKEFFVMGGKAGAIVSGIAYFSTQYSMSTFMGVPAACYQQGYPGLTVSVPGLVFSMIIPALVVGRKLIRLGHKYDLLTVADYLNDRYESDALRSLQAVLMVFFVVPMMGAQIIGSGIIFNTFTGYPEWIGVVATGVIVILYCMSGGIRGAMLTDVVQGLLMVTTAVVTFFAALQLGGGLEAINAKLLELNPAYMAHPGATGSYHWPRLVSMVVMWSFFSIGSPQLVTKFFAMKNYKVMFKAVILGTLGMWVSATLIEWVGVLGIVSVPGLEGAQRDFIVPLILQKAVSPVIASLMIAGIMAAGMSTIDSLLVVSTGGISRDIYQKLLNKDATDGEILKLSRYVTVVLGIIAILFGIWRPGAIFDIIIFSFGGLTIWATPILLGLYWKRTSGIGAITGIIVGVLVYIPFSASTAMLDKLGLNALQPLSAALKSYAMGFDALIPTWIVAMIVTVLVSLVTKPVSEATLKRHFS
ncbi:MAG: sodium:solute symporter family protein [Synergistaceae bacterium]|nr:sodium:solute symporter family protein [Synergistaceae bacterium]